MTLDMDEKIHRTSSYQRLKEKLKRNPSERVDTSDWPRPDTAKEVIQHAVKGATSKFNSRKNLRVWNLKY